MKQQIKTNRLEALALQIYNEWKGLPTKQLNIPSYIENKPIRKYLKQQKKVLKKERKICPECNKLRFLTIDHIIPKWILIQTYIFDIHDIAISNNYKEICGECNLKKAGKIDYSIPAVRIYMKKLANEILKKINIVDNSS